MAGFVGLTKSATISAKTTLHAPKTKPATMTDSALTSQHRSVVPTPSVIPLPFVKQKNKRRVGKGCVNTLTMRMGPPVFIRQTFLGYVLLESVVTLPRCSVLKIPNVCRPVFV